MNDIANNYRDGGCSCPLQSRREFLRLSVGTLALLTARPSFGQSLTTQPAAADLKYYGVFSEFPLGAVKPRGWIKGWLQRQLDGLTGHPENLAYPYNTCMYAGKIPSAPVPHGQIWWPYEQSGYFVDGAVRLSHLIDDPRAKLIPETNLKYILEHSGPGKFGESIWGWPNTVVGRALMAQYSATEDGSVFSVLNDCILGSRGKGGRDGYVFEEALYLYRMNGDRRLLEIAQQDYDRYFFSDPSSFSHVEKIRGTQPLRAHGVTTAEQLKLLPLMYCHTGDPQAMELANLAYRKVESESLMPDGGIVSSENLGAIAFDSLHETCDITDWSWSMGYLLMAGGEAHWADRIEQMIFNALPGAVTKDFKQLQYFSSVNQILASNTACPRIAPTRMSYRAAHDTECCSGNVNRAMPNFVSRMWMRTGAGVAATLYGPSELNTTINGQVVTITEDTDYPFRETISFQIKLKQPATFAMALRIPQWCAAASVTVNDKPSQLECQPDAFVTLKRQYGNGDRVVLRLPMTVRLKEWFNGRAVSLERGPLVYSLAIDEKRIESHEDSAPIKRVLKGNNIQGFPALEFYPGSEWRYGLDLGGKDAAGAFKVIESPMGENPFVAESVPVRIETELRVLPQWEAGWNPTPQTEPADIKTAIKNPTALPDDAVIRAAGESKTMTLLPYASTHLRLTTFPIIKA